MARGDVDEDLEIFDDEEQPVIRTQRPARRSNGRMAVLASVILLAVLGGAVYLGVGWLSDNVLREALAADYDAGDMGDEVTITVESGDAGQVIANKLRNADVVKSANAFLRVCEDHTPACQDIQPGLYPLRRHSPAEEAFKVLVDPTHRVRPPGTATFTIPEGKTVIETLALLAEKTGIPLADFQAAIAEPSALGITADWYSRLDDKDSAAASRKSVEGFLFPSTYEFSPGWSAHQILQMMVDQFKVVAGRAGLKAQADRLGISPYEVLITASLAEKEVLAGDFAKLARVAYNRVYVDNPDYAEQVPCRCLQFDSTGRYWQEIQAGEPLPPGGVVNNHDADNPYNSYDVAGLPVGPISNPGEAALKAAGDPADGKWLYFVKINNDGDTAFAETRAEHCVNINTARHNGVDVGAC